MTYAKKIQLLQVGREHNWAIHNLAAALTATQSVFDFEFSDSDMIAEPSAEHDTFPDQALEEAILKWAASKSGPIYPIAITSMALGDEMFSVNDERYAVISTHLLKFIEPADIVRTFAYLIAPILVDHGVATDVHDRQRNCPNDLCDEPSEVLSGIAKAEFCNECRRAMLRGIDQGRLMLREMVAVSQILDYVGRRKICFAIMPFKKAFDAVYRVIKRATSSAGLDCLRADEILGATRQDAVTLYPRSQ